MLIENPTLLIAACTGGAAALSAVMRATSGQMGGALRHGLAGLAPVATGFAFMLGPRDSVVASGADVLTLGAAALAGIGASLAVNRAIDRKKTRALR